MFRKTIKSVILAGLFLLILSSNGFSQEVWQDMTGSIKDLDLRVIAVDPSNPQVIFTGSSKMLYRSIDGGKSWEEAFTVYGAGELNYITINKKSPSTMYLATSNGLFKTINSGSNWRRVFKGIGEGKKEILSVAIHPFDSNLIYAGTKYGLFSSKDGSRTWYKLGKGISNEEINFILPDLIHSDILYIATRKGVFKSTDMASSWQKIFTIREDKEEQVFSDVGDEETQESQRGVSCIRTSTLNADRIYIGTHKGIFTTEDSGKEWKKMTSIGLIEEDIKFIATSPLCIATEKGVFRFHEEKKEWQRLHKGITAERVNMLSFDFNTNSLWAAGDGGVFKISAKDTKKIVKKSIITPQLKDEPTIREIQKAAIRYAEVEPEKIKRWRRGAKYRSLFPELSVDYDKTINYDSGSDSYYVGPRDWGINLKWDLADLIWNPYQKDIDVRSRLMVQLRDDVLDEVTHLYYERRRLQKELISPSEIDSNSLLDKELQLQELTANIDALTDGYFSKRLKSIP